MDRLTLKQKKHEYYLKTKDSRKLKQNAYDALHREYQKNKAALYRERKRFNSILL